MQWNASILHVSWATLFRAKGLITHKIWGILKDCMTSVQSGYISILQAAQVYSLSSTLCLISTFSFHSPYLLSGLGYVCHFLFSSSISQSFQAEGRGGLLCGKRGGLSLTSVITMVTVVDPERPPICPAMSVALTTNS